MKLIKNDYLFNLLIIFGVFLFFVPFIIGIEAPERVGIIFFTVLWILIFIAMLVGTVREILKKQYTTIIYIVFMDIIKISCFAALSYMLFSIYGQKDITALEKANNNRDIVALIFVGASSMEALFKCERFKKKVH